jgi:signal transduction histidine kinase
MSGQSFDQFLFIVLFIYGLSFFGMGLTLALESGRLASLAEARVLRPLAFFGFLHASHEWIESYLLQVQIPGAPFAGWLPWLEFILLIASYIALFLYGIRTFREPAYRPWIGMVTGISILGVYALAISISAFITYHTGPVPWDDFLNAMSRYLLAVPSALLAVLALRFQALQASARKQKKLSSYLVWAAVAFGIYGLTHLVVHPLAMFPANYLNTETFRTVTGFPIQIIRTLAAILITLSLLWATQETGKERQQQFVAAQQERLQALEQIQSELAKREELRRELLRHTVQAQEEERARIARELHDETSQVLTAYSLNLATLRKSVEDRPQSREIIDRLQSLCKEMSQGLYRLVHDLRPAQLDDLGLIPALEYLQESHRSKELNIAMTVNGKPRRVDSVVETVLFRVAQEALNNVVRHAQARTARIVLEYKAQEILLQIADNGAGFDVDRTFAPPRGWGLAGMRERVEAVGGLLQIESALGKGTTVAVTVQVYDIIP